MDSPYVWGLPPHIKEWRPHQLETVLWADAITGYAFLEAPTGSGKTGIAKALSKNHTLIAVAKTKLLQETVYREHGFSVLMGQGNYACIHPDYRGRTAEDCPFEDKGECERSKYCPYREAVRTVMGSRAGSINYAYYLSTKHMWNRKEYFVFDEAHLLPEITLEYVGISLDSNDFTKWRLPRPPTFMVDGTLDITGVNRPERGIEWLSKCVPIMKGYVNDLCNRTDVPGMALCRQASRLLARIERARDKMEQNPIVWFIESSPERFYAKPLTARYHFSDLFGQNKPTLMMSGTIGDFETLGNELGLTEFQEMRVPSRFAPERRPVYDLGCPKLSHKSPPEDYDEQARLISAAIESVPSDWDGVIHTTKKQHAYDLATRLARNGLQNRIWVTPLDSTDKQIKAWREHKMRSRANKQPGQIAVAWSWTEGVDLREERICITAKCLTPDMVLATPINRHQNMTVGEAEVGKEVYTLDRNLQPIITRITDVLILPWYDGLVFDWRRRSVDATVTAEHQMMVYFDGSWRKVDMLNVPEVIKVASWNRRDHGVRIYEMRRSRQISSRYYQGLVWCVETEAGTILAGRIRQNHFLWMGNCPFGDLGTPYERARFNFSHSFYLQRAAWDLQQQLGRTRRGEEDDYDDGDDMRGLVAIADGNYRKVRKYLSPDFRDSIIE